MAARFFAPATAFLAAALPGTSASPVQQSRHVIRPIIGRDGDFQADIINSTGFYRGQHGLGPLVWNSDLANIAQNWANGCVNEHSNGPTGENLIWGGYPTTADAVDMWGDERKYYNWQYPDFYMQTGHFTQIVWAATTEIGCAQTNCDNLGGAYIVCEFSPHGNVLGQFAENVPLPVSGWSQTCFEDPVCNPPP